MNMQQKINEVITVIKKCIRTDSCKNRDEALRFFENTTVSEIEKIIDDYRSGLFIDVLERNASLKHYFCTTFITEEYRKERSKTTQQQRNKARRRKTTHAPIAHMSFEDEEDIPEARYYFMG